MRVIFVRHGETDWNVTLQYQGQAQISLNRQGRAQARYAAERLRTVEASAMYTSDLARAWETAEIISEKVGLSPQPMPNLREIDVGQWQGLTPAQLEERFPEHMREYHQDPANTVRLGGESYAQLQQRSLAALRDIEERHEEGETILVVSHGGSIRTIVCHILGLDLVYFGRMWLHNGSLTEVQHGARGWRLMRLNDAAHLEGRTIEGGE